MTVLPYIYFGILCTYEDDGYEQGRMKGHASAVIPQAADDEQYDTSYILQIASPID